MQMNYNPHNLLSDLYLQNSILKINCPFVTSRVFETKRELIGKFNLTDRDWRNDYSFLFSYKGSNNAITWLCEPLIPGNPDIHLYENKAMCLFFPNEFSRYRRLLISRDIVAKCRAWADNYELFLVNGGKWLGNQRPHGESQIMEDYHYLKTGRTDLFNCQSL